MVGMMIRRLPAATCAYQLRHPCVSMVKSSEKGHGGDRSAGLNRPPIGCILTQREMDAGVVVVGSVSSKHVAEMALAKDQYVVEAFPPHRPDQPFHRPVLPR